MRKRFTAKLKAQVALEAVRNESTIAELAKKYDINPTQIQRWKADLIANAEQVFSAGKGEEKTDDKYIEALERKAGQLALEVDFLKKKLRELPQKERIAMINRNHNELSIRRQSALLGIHRSNLYYEPCQALDESVLANEIQELWMEDATSGYRRITHMLKRSGHTINHKRVLRIMREASIAALYPKPRTSLSKKEHVKYPYLLKNLVINRPNQVWATDITYIKIAGGWMYLIAIIDVYSRYILAWCLSNTLETAFCKEALQEAFARVRPEIINTDQGCQFTSEEWITYISSKGVKISMDGVGRWADNIYIERFWRTLKYEQLFLHAFDSVVELKSLITSFIHRYNTKRLHQNLNYNTPFEVYTGAAHAPAVCRKPKVTTQDPGVKIEQKNISILTPVHQASGGQFSTIAQQ